LPARQGFDENPADWQIASRGQVTGGHVIRVTKKSRKCPREFDRQAHGRLQSPAGQKKEWRTMRRHVLVASAIGFWAIAIASAAFAQQVVIATPHPTASSSFYEQIGVQWGVRGKGWFFNFGGPPPVPQFGGFDPNAGASFGFGGRNGFFNITAGQGASTTFGSQTPMITLPNGGFAVFNDQINRPFVTSVVPVLGGEPPVFPSVLAERLHRLQTETPGEANNGTPLAGSPPSAVTSIEQTEQHVAVARRDSRVEEQRLVGQPPEVRAPLFHHRP
jgi:hypothetical protein